MNDRRVRSVVAQYLTGTLTESEAARRADLSRAELRHYARTPGTVIPAPALEPVPEGKPEAGPEAEAGSEPISETEPESEARGSGGESPRQS